MPRSPAGASLVVRVAWIGVAAAIAAVSLGSGVRDISAADVTPLTFAPDADATLRREEPDTNFGRSGRLPSDGSPTEESIVRFRVSGLSGTVTEAKLRLYVHNGSADGPQVYLTAPDWSESAVSWSTKPPRISGVVAEAGRATAGAWLEIDVTAAITGNGTYSLNLASSSEDATEASSRHATNPPRLVVTTGAPPASSQPSASPSGSASPSPSASPSASVSPSASPTASPTPRPTTDPSTAPGMLTASAETEPVPNGGDAADDAAVWIHPTDTSRSTIVGTDKQGGLAVYDLAGNELHYHEVGDMNNVDLRYNFPLGGQRVALVAASDRSANRIALYRVDPATRDLVDVAARTIGMSPEPYGLCMYRSPTSDRYFVIANTDDGDVRQWELFDNGADRVDAIEVRSLEVGSTTEGCVADDELGDLYIGEEDEAIWKYGAEPGAGRSRTLVDSVHGGRLEDDIEGLTIYHTPDGGGYLIASSQGEDRFVVYERAGDNPYVTAFEIEAGGIDGVSGTDGIDVANVDFGPAFPAGVFVAQDNTNSSANQNFKLVRWEAIAGSVSPSLAVDTRWDPRAAGR
ncbi:MAG TPA: phytase [Candidatus Limnocylindria bacterium]|nr:phytase [Candidatus Limnocylindria bacterium]